MHGLQKIYIANLIAQDTAMLKAAQELSAAREKYLHHAFRGDANS